MIVVEGPDGAGKTTLVEQLIETFPNQLEKSPHSQLSPEERKELKHRNQRQFVYGALSDALSGNMPVYVHDRIFFSHLVYQPILDGRLDLTTREIITVRRVILAVGIPVIMCLPPFGVVEENVKNNDQMAGVVEKLPEIYDAYQHIVRETQPAGSHDVMFYDYTGTRTGFGSYATLDTICDRVRQYLERRKERTWT